MRAGRRHQDEFGAHEMDVSTDTPRQVFAGQSRHHLVEKYDVVRLAAMPGTLEFRQRVEPVHAAFRFHAEAAQLAGDDFQIHFDIVDGERANAFQVRRQIFAIRQNAGSRFQGNLKEEGGAEIWPRCHADFTSHQLDELL